MLRVAAPERCRPDVPRRKDRCGMSMMIKEAPLSEKDMVAEAEKALADISQSPRRRRPGHLRPGKRRRAHAGGAARRRPRAAGRRSRPRQDQAGRDARHRARPRRPPHPVHARPDAVRHSRLRGDGAGRARQALLPLHLRPDLRAAADGRRDQPRQPAHPVGAAAVDAGISRHGRRRPPRPAGALPRAGHPEPAGAGRHLSAAGSPARPLPDADRHPLSRDSRPSAASCSKPPASRTPRPRTC